MNPLQLHLKNSPICQSDLDKLTLPALLWGYRHRLWGFEWLVHFAERNYARYGDLLDDLAILTKSKYSEDGPEILQSLQLAVVTDTVEAHRKAADEIFSLLFQRLHAMASPQQFLSVFEELNSVFIFYREESWSGNDAIAPYINDSGPSQEIIDSIFGIKIQLNKTGVTPQLWDTLLRSVRSF